MANTLRTDRYGNEAQKAQFLNSIFVIDDTKTIMDLGSGSGKLTQELEKTGANVFAVDRRQPTVDVRHYVQADFFHEAIPVSGVDIAFMLYPYLGEEWWNFNDFLGNVAQTMKKGGFFALDLGYYYTVPFGYTEEFDTPKDDHVLTSFLIRKSGGFMGHMTKKYPEGKTVEYDMMWRIFEQEELAKEVRKSGFELRHTYLDFKPGEYDGDWLDLPEKTCICVVLERV